MRALLIAPAVLGLMMVVCPARADQADDAARAAYVSASGHFQAGEYREAVNKLDTVIRLLGGQPKRVFLPMLALSLENIEEFDRASAAVSQYFGLRPPPNPALSEYFDMKALQERLAKRSQDEALAQQAEQEKLDHAAYQSARQLGTEAAFESYLSKYRDGLHASDARAHINSIEAARRDKKQRERDAKNKALQKREDAFASALAPTTPRDKRDSLKQFLSRYPNSIQAPQARSEIWQSYDVSATALEDKSARHQRNGLLFGVPSVGLGVLSYWGLSGFFKGLDDSSASNSNSTKLGVGIVSAMLAAGGLGITLGSAIQGGVTSKKAIGLRREAQPYQPDAQEALSTQSGTEGGLLLVTFQGRF